MKAWFDNILKTYIIPIAIMLAFIIVMVLIRCFPFLNDMFKKQCKLEDDKDGRSSKKRYSILGKIS